MDAKSKLISFLKKIDDKRYALSILKWEMYVVAPKSSLDDLVIVMNVLEKEMFDLLSSDMYMEILSDVIASADFEQLSYSERKHIQNLHDSAKRIKNVPSEFYVAYTKEVNISQNVWLEAKKANSYKMFKPHLEKLISMKKELYAYEYKDSENIYDKMLDDYEKGVTTSVIDPIFEGMKEELSAIIRNLPADKVVKDNRRYDRATLLRLGKCLLEYIGYDINRGVLDFYPHGFTYRMGPNDIRIAFDDNRSIYDIVCTIIHEGGHGIFEQNIGVPLEQYPGYHVTNMATHESQSRFFENILGRDVNFWIPIYDKVKDILSLNEDVYGFVSHLNIARPSLIRTEADELTYCMHIILRYEMEKMIFNGDIDIDTLPEIWNKKMKDYLGVDVNNDSQGILQDVHWSQGNFGYFPSYLLGSLFDGILLESINEELGSVDNILKSGNIKSITHYLNENIHSKGMTYNVFELCKLVCKKDFSSQPLLKYFRNKY